MTHTPDAGNPPLITVHIDQRPYRHAATSVTPADIRRIAQPPIADDRQIWLDILDDLDQVLNEGEPIQLCDGMHFFSDLPAITITIDRHTWQIFERKLTGAGLRVVPTPDIAPDRDLWMDVPDARDRKIQDEDVVALTDGLRFYTAPGRINPGHHDEGRP
jgi:hypothetical protein